MQRSVTKKVRCSVGILTFNSGKTLRRALESVKDFSDIVISDGGSTDETLAIAREYGATIIEQIAKYNPGPEPRHPITDFAAEHNQLLDAAKEDWYLRLDADEYISKELHDEIVVAVQDGEIDAYELPMQLQSPDGSTTYYMPQIIRQARLVRRVKGRFERPVHERFFFTEPPRTKTLTGPWYVPINRPDFVSYKWAVNYRLALPLKSQARPTVTQYLWAGVLVPLKHVAGIFWRTLRSRLFSPFRQHLPFFYVRNRLYSEWVAFRLYTTLFIKGKL